MRTRLSQFCEEFERIVRPLLDPLKKAADSLSFAAKDLPGKEVRAELSDLAHQMEVLADKVAEQQAYVLIFGPLKSGKSTLMNALSSSYVSEVTSLPAYPCMVYVSHSEFRRYTVTHYDSSFEDFTDASSMRMSIGRAHTELAQRIRASEQAGESFDPALQFTEAIRRIDVRLPAGDLAQSGAVLVDTPGLYSRMKFGYDRMTRDFRNVAACAIFVVKSDNLFLEQVFEEFNSLLELFNRIFLVVNLDTAKTDLSPDGRLVPSLEREDPLRIIQAFENLSMSAPLKAAAESGRLRIYPVDLLRAASRRLLAANGEAPEETDAKEEDYRGEANFDAFLKDLTDYLNSTDYLVAFLGDSLRRASTLLAESVEICRHPSIEALRRRTDEYEQERAETVKRLRATEALTDFDWDAAFAALEDALGPAVREQSARAQEKISDALDGAIERWFQNEDSLQHLVENELTPLLASYQEELSLFVGRALEERVREGNCGMHVPHAVGIDLAVAELDLDALGSRVLGEVDRETWMALPRPPLRSEQIPVRKRLWDWILLRSRAAVRKRVFGPADRPSLRIAVDSKRSRLGDPAKETIRRELDQYKGSFFSSTIERVRGRLVKDYTRAALEALKQALRDRRETLAIRREDIEVQLREHRMVLNRFTELQTASESASGSVEELSGRYIETDPDLLIQPMPGERPLPPAPSEAFLEDNPLVVDDSRPEE